MHPAAAMRAEREGAAGAAAAMRHRVTADRLGWRYLRRRGWAEGLSKAAVARLVGQRDALSTEQSYLRTVIPRALLRAAGTVLRGRVADGLAAAGGLLFAVAATGAGYVFGRAFGGFGRAEPVPEPAKEPFRPTAVCTVDISDSPIVTIELPAMVLVRTGRFTLGAVRVEDGWHEHRATVPGLRRQLRGYGTGLAAMFLVHATRPGGLAGIAARLPCGLVRLLHPESERNVGRSRDYSRQLVLDELRGIAAAPIAVLLETVRRGRRR